MAINQGAVPVDYSTPTGQVRALLGDTDAIDLVPPEAGQGSYAWYSDAAIGGLLTVYGGSARRASAQALRTVASSQALILKKFSTDDLSVDGAAIAEALRKLAKDLDEQANTDDSNLDIFELIPLAGSQTLHPELAPFVFGQRYGLAVVDDGLTYSDGGYTQDGGILWGE